MRGVVPVEQGGRFPGRKSLATGAWTLVLRARFNEFETGSAAMERLCNAYCPAVEEFLTHWNGDREWARSRSQEFMAHLNSGNCLRYLRSDHGHFRNFLFHALRVYMTQKWKSESAACLGADNKINVILEDFSEQPRARNRVNSSILAIENATQEIELEATRSFARKWAIRALERTIHKMEVEGEASESPKLYLAVCEFLSGAREIPYESFKNRFGLSEGATRVALQRLRLRFVEFLRGEIRETVQSDELVSREIQVLRDSFT